MSTLFEHIQRETISKALLLVRGWGHEILEVVSEKFFPISADEKAPQVVVEVASVKRNRSV